MKFLRPAALIAFASLLGSCGQSGGSGDVGGPAAGGPAGGAVQAPGASVSFDVVGVKPGTKHPEMKARLEAEGWSLTDATSDLVELPGGVPSYTVPNREIWYRAVEDSGMWRTETLAVNFAPTLPGKPAEAYLIMFSRIFTEGPTTIQHRVSQRAEITQDYSIQTLAAVKSKYGEPRETGEGACESYGGVEARRSIPIYELSYTGMTVNVGDTCGQTLDIRIEDSALRRARQIEFDAFREQQVQRATSAGAKSDF